MHLHWVYYMSNKYKNYILVCNYYIILGFEQSRPILTQIQEAFLNVEPIIYKLFIKSLNKISDYTVNDYIQAQLVVKNIPVRKIQYIII